MRFEAAEVQWLDEQRELSLTELADLSGLSESELLELVDCGALEPVAPRPDSPVFTARCVVVARTASRLRDDFELDSQGVALVLTLLDRVHDLEGQLQQARALLPRRR